MALPPGLDPKQFALLAGVTLLSALLLLRLHAPLAVALLSFSLGAVFFILIHLARESARRQRSRPATGDFGVRVQGRLRDARSNEARFREESEHILRSIRTLKEDLAGSHDTSAEDQTRAAALIRELEAEFSLRNAKATFYADCATRLEQLLSRHRLLTSMEERRRELDHLRRNNYDDEAAVEEVRYHLEQDNIELDTIMELSGQPGDDGHVERAEELRQRLEALRKRLDEATNGVRKKL